MPRLPHLHRRAVWALALGLLVIAAADAQPAARPDLAARLQRATAALDLTAEQRAALDAVAARYADPQPGALWAVAADVEDVLTDAQVAQLRDGLAARGGDRRRGRADRPRTERVERPRLTAEQRQALREARETARPRLQTLREQLRAGEITAEAFRQQSRTLREEAAAGVQSALPAEHWARLEAARARRAAEIAARGRALSLTDAQKEAVRDLALERARTAPERTDLRPYLDENGRLDREALREARRAEREGARDERPSLRERAEEVLTADQRDIMTVHRVLAGHRARPDGARREGAREGRRGVRERGARGARGGAE